MVAGKRIIKNGYEFEHLVEKPTGKNELIKRNSKLEDTVRFLPQAIYKNYQQARHIAPLLKGKNTYDTCRNIWNWAYHHFQYEKDEKLKEQIRSFRRSFWDRFIGIDCDDFSVLISSLLICLGIKHALRVAKYKEADGFQHIYPIVPIGNGQHITIDCVIDQFNYEVPTIDKIDTHMDLEFLDGIDDMDGIEDTGIILNGIDAEDLMSGNDEIGDLGRRKLKDTKIGQKISQKVNNFKNSKVGQALKKGIHIANKVNPGAALLRAGILAALKTNMFKIAENLKFAYLSRAEAARQELDMSKFDRLIGVKEKLEKIYYGAGGKPENFKKAILTGRGNRGKEVPVAGLGAVDPTLYTEADSLSQILGMETYMEEMSGVEGLGSLGEPATGAAIAAATSVLAAISGLLKSIGILKKSRNGGKGGDASSEAGSSDATSEATSSDTGQESSTDNAGGQGDGSSSNEANTDGGENNEQSSDTPADNGTPAAKSGSSSNLKTTSNSSGNASTGAFAKVKDWISQNKVATGVIAVSAIGLIVWGISAYNKSKPKSKASGSLAGFPGSKHKRSKRRKKTKSNPFSYQKLK